MEVSNNKVLKDFCQHNKITWCYMVNSGMAIIQTEKGLETLDDINKFLDECVLHNKAQQKAKVRDGACYVEGVVLSQYYFGLKEFQELESQGKLKDKVIWERFNEYHDVDGSMGQSGSSNQADSDKEVVVTLQNWPKDLATIKRLLETIIITPYLKTTLKHNQIIKEVDDLELLWVPSNFVFSWKLRTNTEQVARYLCTKVIDLPVQMTDGIGTVSFKSMYHILGRDKCNRFFSQLMLQDVQADMRQAPTRTSTSEGGAPAASSPTSADGSDGWEYTHTS
jgi:hypothetical protein